MNTRRASRQSHLSSRGTHSGHSVPVTLPARQGARPADANVKALAATRKPVVDPLWMMAGTMGIMFALLVMVMFASWRHTSCGWPSLGGRSHAQRAGCSPDMSLLPGTPQGASHQILACLLEARRMPCLATTPPGTPMSAQNSAGASPSCEAGC
jgi:hypothetical protein